MKSTGIVRKIDLLNRIVIPKEICRTFGIEERSPMEIYTDGDKIILKKYEPACIFCGGTDDLRDFGDKKICKGCIDTIGTAVR
jgi:AbrB family transcriptional regulator, transcriptional pleiotropic regulator of transition state genes